MITVHFQRSMPQCVKFTPGTVIVDKEFQRKTNELVRENIRIYEVTPPIELLKIDAETVEVIKATKGGETIKVINLVKSIEKDAEENSDDPFLLAMAERARAVQQQFERRQHTASEVLEELLQEIGKNEERKKEQQAKGFDGFTFFVYRTLLDAGVGEAENVSSKIKAAFAEYPDWKKSEAVLRDLRQKVTFAIFAEFDDPDKVTTIVDDLFTLLDKADRI